MTANKEHAGTLAGIFSPEEELVLYALGAIHRGNTDADADSSLAARRAREEEASERLHVLASRVGVDFVVRTAVACVRAQGRSPRGPENTWRKATAAALVAHLAVRDVDAMMRVFATVVVDGPTLSTFVRTVRSGVTGRKSFGSAPKRALRTWFSSRSPEEIFRQSIGTSPSVSDVIKMVRPPPRNDQGEADAVREALYGYLIGKNVDDSQLPSLCRAVEAWQRDGHVDDARQCLDDVTSDGVPNAPLPLLTARPLVADRWEALAKAMSIAELCASLRTLQNHGVLDATRETGASVAARLVDATGIVGDGIGPYALLRAYLGRDARLPSLLAGSLARAVDLAIANLPRFEGEVVVCPDVSGSMHAPLDRRSRVTIGPRCIDVAILVAAGIARRSPNATILPFAEEVVPLPPGSDVASIVDLAEHFASSPGRGTSAAVPIEWLATRDVAPDLVVVVTDGPSDHPHDARLGATRSSRAEPLGGRLAVAWAAIRARNPRAKLIVVDLAPRGTATNDAIDTLRVSGFSDDAFDAMATFAASDSLLALAEGWVHDVETTPLPPPPHRQMPRATSPDAAPLSLP